MLFLFKAAKKERQQGKEKQPAILTRRHRPGQRGEAARNRRRWIPCWPCSPRSVPHAAPHTARARLAKGAARSFHLQRGQTDTQTAWGREERDASSGSDGIRRQSQPRARPAPLRPGPQDAPLRGGPGGGTASGSRLPAPRPGTEIPTARGKGWQSCGKNTAKISQLVPLCDAAIKETGDVRQGWSQPGVVSAKQEHTSCCCNRVFLHPVSSWI